MEAPTRNFTTISPTARALLLMKSVTRIPFAHAAAQLVASPAEMDDLEHQLSNLSFLRRVLHFENRYWTTEQLYRRQPTSNVLELCAGYAFRGLQHVTQAPVHYVDTDLPDVIATKRMLVTQLLRDQGLSVRGPLHLQPLNALDEVSFWQAIDLLPAGPLTILNEGLLMYLNEAEKRQLCGIIHKILEVRGGAWITGDAYIQRDASADPPPDDEQSLQLAAFLAYHNIEENKFASLEAAEAFFNSCGFVVKDRMAVSWEDLSLLPRIKALMPPGTRRTKGAWKLRESWRLEIG